MRRNENPLKKKFTVQRARAKNCGIAWEMTFEQWLEIWTASEKLALRGKGVGKYVMSRHGDAGPYSVGNVEIVPYEQNAGDVNKNYPDTCGCSDRNGLGRGCYRYQQGARVTYTARFRKKHLGVFDTPEAASYAYQAAHQKYLESREIQ
jgi:hypothetical protein